jgi:Yip1 domain
LTSVSGAAGSPPSSPGFLTLLIGVIRRPQPTFRAVAASPRWGVLMVVLTLAAAGSQGMWLTTERGQLALVDQWERTALAFGQNVDDARYEQLHAFSRNGVFYGTASAVVSGPVLTLLVAAAIFVLFRRVTVEAVSFKQVLSVITCSSVILTLRQVIAAPISFANESTASATSLGRWFGTLDEASPVARFFGAIDLFVVWWVIVLAIGVAVLYRRQARTLTAAFLGVYVGVALLLAAVMTALGGTA